MVYKGCLNITEYISFLFRWLYMLIFHRWSKLEFPGTEEPWPPSCGSCSTTFQWCKPIYQDCPHSRRLGTWSTLKSIQDTGFLYSVIRLFFQGGWVIYKSEESVMTRAGCQNVMTIWSFTWSQIFIHFLNHTETSIFALVFWYFTAVLYALLSFFYTFPLIFAFCKWWCQLFVFPVFRWLAFVKNFFCLIFHLLCNPSGLSLCVESFT